MYKVEIINDGNSLFKIISKNYEFTIDTMGKGVSPPDALLASLGSCVGVYIRKYLANTEFKDSKFSISVAAEFGSEKPVCFRAIDIGLDLKDIKLDERGKEAFISFIKNCPIHNTLKNNPSIEIKITPK